MGSLTRRPYYFRLKGHSIHLIVSLVGPTSSTDALERGKNSSFSANRTTFSRASVYSITIINNKGKKLLQLGDYTLYKMSLNTRFVKCLRS